MMEKLYKVTSLKKMTHNKTKWNVGVEKQKRLKKDFIFGPPIMRCCTDTVFHAFKSLKQVRDYSYYFNDSRYNNNSSYFLVWEAKGQIVDAEFDKVGCSSLTITKLVGIMKGKVIRKPTKLEMEMFS